MPSGVGYLVVLEFLASEHESSVWFLNKARAVAELRLERQLREIETQRCKRSEELLLQSEALLNCIAGGGTSRLNCAQFQGGGVRTPLPRVVMAWPPLALAGVSFGPVRLGANASRWGGRSSIPNMKKGDLELFPGPPVVV